MNPRRNLAERAAVYAQTLSPRLHALATLAVTGGFVTLAWSMGWGLWRSIAMAELAATAAVLSALIRLTDFDAFTELVVESPKWLQRALASGPGATAARCFEAIASRGHSLLDRIGLRMAGLSACAVLCVYVGAVHAMGWSIWKSLAIALLPTDGILVMVLLRWTQLLLRESVGDPRKPGIGARMP